MPENNSDDRRCGARKEDIFHRESIRFPKADAFAGMRRGRRKKRFIEFSLKWLLTTTEKDV